MVQQLLHGLPPPQQTSWPHMPPPCPKKVAARGIRGTGHTWELLCLHQDQKQPGDRQTRGNEGGLTCRQPPGPSPPTPALLGLQWDPCVIAGWPTCGPRFPHSQSCWGWGFKRMTALYLYICCQRPAKASLILDTCKVRAMGRQPAPGQEAALGRKRVGRREEQHQPPGWESQEQGELLSSFALGHTLRLFSTRPKPH